MSDTSPVWLDVAQVAARLGVGTRLVYQLVRDGRMRAARVGGRRQLRIRPEWADEALERMAEPVELPRRG